MKKGIFYILSCLFLISCGGEEEQPKPKGFLALEYPKAKYQELKKDCPFTFEVNELAEVNRSRNGENCAIDLDYKLLNGTVFITYRPVQGNLDSLLTDAQKLPLRHTIKADAIEGAVYTNPSHNTYGMFYEVSGNAASQAQFYVTDSVSHFLTGSVYFNAQPNFDSIYPAAAYLKQDIRHLMETVKWNQQD